MQEQDETLLLEDVCVSRNQSPFTPVGVVGTSQAMYLARAYVSSSKHPLVLHARDAVTLVPVWY